MSEYRATVSWRRVPGQRYSDGKYSRAHTWSFDGGLTVPASSSPQVVPLPYSVEANVDPEEAFVASLSSCHMLFFLSIAAGRRYVVDSYLDDPVGFMGTDADGKSSMTKVILRPKVSFAGDRQPSREVVQEMHHQSHERCYIANSVKTTVVTETA
jgi:organic hydroperoxide reductase OsmC/OhrA